MSSSNSNQWIAPLIIIGSLAIVLGIMYYSSDFYKQRHQGWRNSVETAGSGPGSSQIVNKQIILRRNEKLVVGRNAMVFRGISEDRIILDLYLLDLDPQQSYTKRISRSDGKKGILIGSGKFQVVSANNNYLNMKILSMSLTP